MIILLLLMNLFTNQPLIREMVCNSETKCQNGLCVTKWVCPSGITIVTSEK